MGWSLVEYSESNWYQKERKQKLQKIWETAFLHLPDEKVTGQSKITDVLNGCSNNSCQSERNIGIMCMISSRLNLKCFHFVIFRIKYMILNWRYL